MVGDAAGLPRRLSAPDLAYELENHIVLLDSEAVEVFSHGFGKALFTLPPILLLANHSWRVPADTAG